MGLIGFVRASYGGLRGILTGLTKSTGHSSQTLSMQVTHLIVSDAEAYNDLRKGEPEQQRLGFCIWSPKDFVLGYSLI